MSGQRRERENKNASQLKLYSVFKGEVVSVQEYGAFVKIPNHQKNGLVHRSQISYTKVDDAKDVLDVGDSVFCKVISLGEDNDKIALSMKCVNQGSGIDQDPNHLLTVQDEQRKKSGGGYVKPKIELGAIFNTNCRQCGGQGHLASDCFQAPGSKTYDLVPEFELPPQEVAKAPHQKKKKKEKKMKKKKKRKHHSDADSDSSSDDEPKRKSKHKKRKKSRSSHRHSKHSSDSDSSSEDEPKIKHKKRKKSRPSHRQSQHSSDSSSEDEPKIKTKHKKIMKSHKRSHSGSDSENTSKRNGKKGKKFHEKSEKQEKHRDRDKYR